MKKAENLQLRLLEQLAIYKYLCLSQFIELGAEATKKTLRSNLHSLKERFLCDQHSYRFHPALGRLESVYFLKPKGKWYVQKFCDIADDAIKVSTSKVPIYEQYEHRKRAISIQMYLRMACAKRGIQVLWYDNYFEKKGRTGATRVASRSSFIHPDAIFCAEQQTEVFLFCVELHNQYRVKKIVEQLKPYAYALAEGSPTLKYDLAKSARVLVVFEKQSTLESTLEIISQDPFYLHLKHYFLFAHYDNLKVTPLDHRLNLKGEQVSLFPLVT